MSSSSSRLFHSLRFRIVAAAIFALIAVVSVAVPLSLRWFDHAMLEGESERLAELRVVLGAAVSGVASRDDRLLLADMLKHLQRDRKLDYLVVTDSRGQVIAAEGWDPSKPLPLRSSRPGDGQKNGRFHVSAPILSNDKSYGELHFGVQTEGWEFVRSALFWRALAITGAVVAAFAVLFGFLAAWLMRDLRALARGAAALEAGYRPVRIHPVGNDEVAAVARTFKRLNQNLEERTEALSKCEARFHAIADFTYGVEAWFNVNGRLIWVNRSVERVTGYSASECLLAASVVELLVFEKDRKHALEMAARAMRGGTGENFEIRLRRKDGEVVWVSVNWQPIQGSSGARTGIRVSADEIQGRKEAELKLLDTVAELRRAQALKEYYLNHSNEERSRLEALLNVMKVGVLFVDASNRVLYCNRPFREMWGYGPEENLTGTRDTVLIERGDRLRAEDQAYRDHIQTVLASRESSGVFEIPFKDGRTLAEISALVVGAKPGRYIGRVWIYEDITEQKRIAEKLIQLAERDPLTNLFNRRRFHEELERVIADSARRGQQAGLLAIDLDGFKPINDEFGHQSGDMVLVALADDVASIIRRNEMFFRVGGDEFAVLVPDTSEEQMIGLANRVGSKIAEMRFDFPGREVRVTASLGIALYPVHAASGEEMIARADHAMYQAKSSGKNRWSIYPGTPLVTH